MCNIKLLILLTLFGASYLAYQMAEAKMECSKMRNAFKCIATDRDTADKFKGQVSNIYSTDVTIDVFSVVDQCEKIKNPPSRPARNSTGPPPDRDGASGNGPPPHVLRSTTILARRFDRAVRIARNSQLTVEMERVKVPGYCSKIIFRNCRNAENVQMDCERMISIK